ncbi:hypothetical protein KJ059_02225 [Myxococcota bacterium]|nr:hypothetical protein [Myxococcota bacterium]
MVRSARNLTAVLLATVRSLGGRAGSLALLAVLVAAGNAAAQDGDLLPLTAGAPLELGTAWDHEDQRARGERGACLVARDTETREGGPTTYSLVVLSRAGGRLLLGIHVARTLASEGLVGARITDAARRLAAQDREGFDVLCGSGFLAARAVGGQYVGELVFEPGDAQRASAKLETGVWTDSTRFSTALGALMAAAPARARELPDGSRSDAREIEPSVLLQRALAFPETVTEATAKPFLGAIRRYPDAAFAGTEIAIDPTLGWGDAARQVFLHDRTALSGSSAAVRAAEMRKAVVRRREPSREPGQLPPAPRKPAPADGPAAPVAAADGAASLPAAPARASSPAAPAPVQKSRMAALVYALPGGSRVYATTHAPPGVYAEKVKQREYWIPGVAVPDAAMRAALARAAHEAPARGTTIVVAEVGATRVVMTDDAPAAGIHAVPAGSLQAWIAGVKTPTARQQDALRAAAQATD